MEVNDYLDLYLEGSISEESIVVPCSSAVTLFVLAYCESHAFKINLVSRENKESTKKSWIHLPRNSLNSLSIDFVDHDSIPQTVCQCILPACHLARGRKVLSGTCCVLRHIVKTSKDNDYIHLLGHKEICLKACAEVSVWTKFCEVEMPDLVDGLLCQDATSDSKITGNSSDKTKLMMPVELIKLENHFLQPPIIANKNKRKQDAMKKGKQAHRGQKDLSSNHITEKSIRDLEECTQHIDITDDLEHNFVEGIDFTLADLVLFPSIMIILNHWRMYISNLEKHLPSIIRWCRRILSRPDVDKVIQTIVWPHVDLFSNEIRLHDDSVLIQVPPDCINYNIREPKKKKFKANPNELTKAMAKFKLSGLVKGEEKHPCDDIILPWKNLPEAIHPKDGDLPEERLERKCQQLENLAQAVVTLAKPGNTVVDFCSGGGHLGILLAHLLPDCHIILVENKEESIQKAEQRIERLGLHNIIIYQCNLDYFQGHFDIGTCLHACGVATDLVLQRCLDNRASFVICPCCYGGIQDTHTVTYPRSPGLKNTDFLYKEYLCIGHGADQTQFNSVCAKQGKQCMVYIDSDRAALAAAHGYNVILTTLQPPQCSPKNNLLIGTKAS